LGIDKVECSVNNNNKYKIKKYIKPKTMPYCLQATIERLCQGIYGEEEQEMMPVFGGKQS
jgi:hypothetical protein